MREPCILAGDIGGSKTLLRLYSLKGRILEESTLPGFGTTLESEEDIPELSRGVQEFAASYPVGAAAVNLGGKNKCQIAKVFAEACPGIPVSVFRESEGTAALAIGKNYHAGVILLAGTGSIAVAENRRGECVISDGWGCLIGDAGSGYSIGEAVLRKSLTELDGTEPLSELAVAVTGLAKPLGRLQSAGEYCSLRDRVREHIGALDRRSIASYCRVAAECAARGDQAAISIFEQAGKALAGTVIHTGEKIEIESEKTILVTGGLVHVASFWKDSFEQAIRKRLKVKGFHYLADGLMSGVYEIGLNLLEDIGGCKQ